MDMRCREQPEKWDDSGRDTKGCSSERHIYFWNLIKKLIHSSGNFYKSGSGEQPFVKRKWNRASLTVEASLALPVFLIAVLVLLKIVDLYRLHGMLTVSLQESARYLSVCAYAVPKFTFISNENPTITKIFDTIEYKASIDRGALDMRH